MVSLNCHHIRVRNMLLTCCCFVQKLLKLQTVVGLLLGGRGGAWFQWRYVGWRVGRWVGGWVGGAGVPHGCTARGAMCDVRCDVRCDAMCDAMCDVRCDAMCDVGLRLRLRRGGAGVGLPQLCFHR